VMNLPCQGQTSDDCPVARGVDPSYLYMFAMDGQRTAQYLHRGGISCDIMLPSCWKAYNAHTWDSNVQNATPLDMGTAGSGGYSPLWLPDFGLFAYVGGVDKNCFVIAAYPSRGLGSTWARSLIRIMS
jgi:hypothetical protein